MGRFEIVVGRFEIVVVRFEIVVDRCGSLWVVVDRCGSLWVVPGFSNYHSKIPDREFAHLPFSHAQMLFHTNLLFLLH